MMVTHYVIQVRAPLDSDLTVQSPTGSLSLRGVNGVTLEGRQANISSMANLSLLSQEVYRGSMSLLHSMANLSLLSQEVYI